MVDNLSTHKTAVLYEVFEPAEARRIPSRLEFVYTPKHGSWLSVAECELSVLSRQCLDRRNPDMDSRRRQVAVWEADRNAAAVKVDRQFATADALVKLKRLYPDLEIVDSGMVDHQERPRSSRNRRRVRSTDVDREASHEGVRGAVPRLVGESSWGPYLSNSGSAVVSMDFRKKRSAPT